MNFVGKLPSHFHLLESGPVFFVGVKGVGMTALAVLLAQAGVTVEGADLTESFVTDAQLLSVGITPQPFESAQLGNAKVVVYSGAHGGASHPLVKQALEQGIPCLTHAQALGLLSQEKKTIAVCGVGGKSTTSALVAHILKTALLEPSYAVGVGTIPNLGASGHWNPNSDFFVIEADEYVADPQNDITPRFLYMRPTHVIATSLIFDHPDVYSSLDDTKQAFDSFFSLIPSHGKLVINGDDDTLLACVKNVKSQAIRVGERENNDVILRFHAPEDGFGSVSLTSPGLSCDGWELSLAVPGHHNLRNAAFAAVLCSTLGIGKEPIFDACSSFLSTPRRFEFHGKNTQGARFFDDYAHHPHELAAITQTCQEWFASEQKILVFQPHTFSRTKALLNEFAQVLAGFEGEVIVLPIFASSREAFDPSITSNDLVLAITSQGGSARLLTNEQDLVEYFQALPAHSVAITTGAGDIYKVYDKLTLS